MRVIQTSYIVFLSFERSEPTVDARRRQTKGLKSSISKTADLSSRQSEATRDLKKNADDRDSSLAHNDRFSIL